MLKKLMLLALMFCAPFAAQAQEYTRPEVDVPFVDRKGFIEQFMDKEGFALMQVWAEWCPYCKRSIPTMEEYYDKYGEKMPLRLLDYDKEREIIKQLGVKRLPSLYLFQDGDIIATYTGVPLSLWDLENWVRKRSKEATGKQAIGGRLTEGKATLPKENEVARGSLGGPASYVPGGPVMQRDGKPYTVPPKKREIPEAIRTPESAGNTSNAEGS